MLSAWRGHRLALACVAFLFVAVAGSRHSYAGEADAQKPVPAETEAAMIIKSIPVEAPIYIRVFKEESELEVWKQRPNGRYALIKTFPVCRWSGGLGPKQVKGDLMSPEGFYGFTRNSLNPASKYHLSLNIGYPNALDRALGRSGSAIMVHGNCVSVGCFAMSDKLIEEIYAMVRVALDAGQTSVPVHVFPFHMTGAKIAQHSDSPSRDTWGPLKEAYGDFATSREPPSVGMCGKHYVVNSISPVGNDPVAACPTLIGKRVAPLSPRFSKKLAKADPAIQAPGEKLTGKQTTTVASIADFFSGWGLGSSSGGSSEASTQSASAEPNGKPAAPADSSGGPLQAIGN